MSDPIQMILTCPQCCARHVDRGRFAHQPHHTHACQSCGAVWRPAVEATVGVQFLPGFRDPPAPYEPPAEREPGARNHNEPWTPGLDQRLRQLCRAHTVEELGRMFGRTNGAIEARLQKLGIWERVEVPAVGFTNRVNFSGGGAPAAWDRRLVPMPCSCLAGECRRHAKGPGELCRRGLAR